MLLRKARGFRHGNARLRDDARILRANTCKRIAQHDHHAANAAVAHHQIRAVTDDDAVHLRAACAIDGVQQIFFGIRKIHIIRRSAHAKRGVPRHRLIHAQMFLLQQLGKIQHLSILRNQKLK